MNHVLLLDATEVYYKSEYIGGRVSAFSEFQVVLETHPAGAFLVCAASDWCAAAVTLSLALS